MIRNTDFTGVESQLSRGWKSLSKPVDPASLALFRILFGLLTLVSSLRFLANDWVTRFFVEPSFFFHYWGASWVTVFSGPVMTGLVILLCILSLLIALGLYYRVAIVAFFLLFTYIELTDVTNYLNHYYLVSLLAFWLLFLPAECMWSLDSKRKPSLARTHIPAWNLWGLRWQVGLVYFFAAIAKMQPDWLLHAQPLNIWLMARTDFPAMGSLFSHHETALVLSWAGFLNDLLMAPALLWKRTRVVAYSVVVVFHLATGFLFNIGMFPFIMIAAATVFFSPSWPRIGPLRAAFPVPEEKTHWNPIPWKRPLPVAVLLFCLFQGLFPLRSFLHEGPVIWNECGMRFAWKVKVREKTGGLNFLVRVGDEEKLSWVSPGKYLTRYQEREIVTQPDLILQLAHHIGEEYAQKTGQNVAVFADAKSSLNGRPTHPLIDPKQDLMKAEDGFLCPDWILPPPETDPPRLTYNPAKRFERRK